MNDLSTVEWLSKAVGRATKSAKFCVSGILPVVDPGLDVEGLGPIKFPLKGTKAKALVAACQVAPYGKGEQTLVDKQVRNTYELDPGKFHLSDAWNAAVAEVLGPVAEQLGLPAEQLEARLYKLLVYDKGGFFLAHRDSEKHDRMVASLIVALPNHFEGGTLVVRHGAQSQRLPFAEAAAGKSACYAAFYADCEHEVQRTTKGVRLCLAYNLVLKTKRARPSAVSSPSAPVDVLAESIRSWFEKQPTEPLVFALEHHYTQAGLSLDLLKGADRRIADLAVAAAEKTDCLVHLAQVTRHLSQYADDGSFENDYYSRRYRPMRRREIEIGETYEDELNGSEWTDSNGKKQSWGEIEFDLPAIVSSVPIDDWKPTSEEYEGYTGNAGNTLERWYHRSAIVVWPRDHHFNVVAKSGAANSIPIFCSMTAKLAKTPKKRLEGARLDCVRFARAIVAEWPRRSPDYWRTATYEKSTFDDFSERLLTLNDRGVISLFLTKLTERDSSLSLSSFLPAACREFGWGAFAQELKNFFPPRPNERGRQEIPLRDVDWLVAFCCDETANSDKTDLANELCALAVKRFCELDPPQSNYDSSRFSRNFSVSEKSLPLLLKALVATGREEDLSRVLAFVYGLPDEFRMDECLVPGLKVLIPWSRKQAGSVPPPLASWLASVRQKLEAATTARPTPPTDWARSANAACKCQYCAQLNAFLADPANMTKRIPAREASRNHLDAIIRENQCDVKSTLVRQGSPYSLALTKTTGSYERAVKRFEANLKLLSELPVLE